MKPQKNALEWAVFAVSAILVAAVAAVLIVSGARSAHTPPSLVIESGAVEKDGDAYRVPIKVRNTGDETAEQARIEVELTANGEIVERAELTFAFIPKRSSREGWVELHRDPRCCTIATRASFNRP